MIYKIKSTLKLIVSNWNSLVKGDFFCSVFLTKAYFLKFLYKNFSFIGLHLSQNML